MGKAPETFSRWRHQKSGKHYVVLGTVQNKTSDEDEWMVLYRPVIDHSLYVRTIHDFLLKFSPVTGVCRNCVFYRGYPVKGNIWFCNNSQKDDVTFPMPEDTCEHFDPKLPKKVST